MFLSSLKQCINIYDVMLLSFEQIKDQSMVKLISDFNPQEYSYYAGIISQYVEESEISTINAMSNLIQNIESAYQKKKFGFNEFYAIISTIDNRCEYIRREMFQGEFSKFEGVNTLRGFGVNVIPIIKNTIIEKYDESVKIFEKACGKRGYGLKAREKLNNGDINNYLENYIIVREQPYKVNVFSISNHFNFFTKAFNENLIDIVSVPMINSETDKIFDFNADGNNIRIKGIKEEYRNQIKTIYENSLVKNDRPDVLIFPELFFTDMDLNEVCDIVSNTETERDGLIVLGSYCKDGANKCVVITSNGTVLFEQHKKTNYIVDGKYEDLSNSDNIINLIDVEGVGRICVVICKDILNDDIKRYIKILNVDILVIVSYSPSLDMKSSSEELAKSCRSISIMCNSCSAIRNEGVRYKKIGYIVIPVKQETFRDYHTEFYTNEQCSQCKMCLGHRLNIKYDEIKLYDNNKIGAKIYKTIEK